jgi:hypothetical protein
MEKARILEFKAEIKELGPVTIKADQNEVHASFDRQDWGAVRCPAALISFSSADLIRRFRLDSRRSR